MENFKDTDKLILATGHPPRIGELSALKSRRLCSMPEGRKFNAERVKALTGADPIKARRIG